MTQDTLIKGWTVFGIVLTFFDGLFHLFTLPEALVRVAPDWIVAEGLFDAIGLSVFAHRVMGVFLIVSSVTALYLSTKQKVNRLERTFLLLFRWVVVPVTAFMILLAVVIKVGGIA